MLAAPELLQAERGTEGFPHRSPGLGLGGETPPSRFPHQVAGYSFTFTGLPEHPDCQAASVSWMTLRNSSGGVWISSWPRMAAM